MSNQIKNKLAELKDLLHSDPHTLNAADVAPNLDELPQSENIKYIDYDEVKKGHTEYATKLINSIVANYVSNEKLRATEKVEGIIAEHIKTLAEYERLVGNSERNLTTIQEAIDGGDMSKDMWGLARDYSMEMRNNIEARGKHITFCEKYWKDYALNHAQEVIEEKIVDENKALETDEQVVIIDTRSINDIIQGQISAAKQTNSNNTKTNN